LMRGDSVLVGESMDENEREGEAVKYPYYVEVLGSIAFHTPIAHVGSAGHVKRDLTMTDTVKIARLLEAGEFTLTSGSIDVFNASDLKAVRTCELARIQQIKVEAERIDCGAH
jgi:hypothetical protein